MRVPEYLSPSALNTFERDREEYYLKYLAEHRPPRTPQTEPQAVGSAFDAFVKSYLHSALFGNFGKDNEYELNKIFEQQVQEHVRDMAFEAGKYVFQCYQRCGALADIMAELNTSISEPRFEFEIKDTIQTKIGNIPLLGKPDISFVNDQAAKVIFDWKVNGYFSNSRISPKKGYIKCRDTWGGSEAKPSRNNGLPHKDAVVDEYKGIKINLAHPLNEVYPEWADQLTIYAWMLGEPIGSEELIFGIDQLVCAKKPDRKPLIRVANHRSKVSASHQFALLERVQFAWSCITGQFFHDLSEEENEIKCQNLERMAESLSSNDPLTKFVNKVSRGW